MYAGSSLETEVTRTYSCQSLVVVRFLWMLREYRIRKIENALSEAQSSNQFDIFYSNYTSLLTYKHGRSAECGH